MLEFLLSLTSVVFWTVVLFFSLWLAAVYTYGSLTKAVYDWMWLGFPARKQPDLVLYDGAGGVYLKRWWIIPRNKYLNFYLHQFLGDDPAVPHDHPYRSLSWMIKGCLYEHLKNGGCELRGEGDLLYRDERMSHRIEVLREHGVVQDAWSIFCTGPRIREWGFHCPKGWVAWPNFQANKGERKGESGEFGGCGEFS